MTRIQLRRDTGENWYSKNPILAQGEIGLVTDTYVYKVGDGQTNFVDLPTRQPLIVDDKGYIDTELNINAEKSIRFNINENGSEIAIIEGNELGPDGGATLQVMVDNNGNPGTVFLMSTILNVNGIKIGPDADYNKVIDTEDDPLNIKCGELLVNGSPIGGGGGGARELDYANRILIPDDIGTYPPYNIVQEKAGVYFFRATQTYPVFVNPLTQVDSSSKCLIDLQPPYGGSAMITLPMEAGEVLYILGAGKHTGKQSYFVPYK